MFPVILLLVAAQPPAPSLTFSAHRAGGKVDTGRFAGLAPKWGMKLAEPAATIPPGDLVSLARADSSRPAWPVGPQLILANGDRLPGNVLGGDDLSVRIRPAGYDTESWRVPLAQVRVLWVESPPADTPATIARYPWLDPKRSKDALLFRNGDVRAGDLERFAEDGKSLVWKPAGGAAGTTVELSQLSAVMFNPALVVPRPAKAIVGRLVLANGARLTATVAESGGERLRGILTTGARFDLPLSDLIALDVERGKAAYLSDLKPTTSKTEPFGALAWPPVADLSAKSRPLRLATPRGEETFDRGLGTHPKTTLTYPLGGKYRRFEAFVGTDAVTGRRGAASVRVTVDGVDCTPSALTALTAADGTVEVSLDITKAKQLTLVIDFGPAGDVQADVNWANARLVE